MIMLDNFIGMSSLKIDFWGTSSEFPENIDIQMGEFVSLKRYEMCHPKFKVEGGFVFCPDRINVGEKLTNRFRG